MNRNDVYAAVDSERGYQDRKWGAIDRHPHEVGGWILLMENALRQAKEAWSGAPNDNGALEEVRKVVGLGVACAEQHGIRPRWKHELKERMRGERSKQPMTRTPIPDCPKPETPIRDRAWTDEQITAAARALCDRSAEVCNVDPQDNWSLYAHEFIEDAKAALSAVNGATP